MSTVGRCTTLSGSPALVHATVWHVVGPHSALVMLHSQSACARCGWCACTCDSGTRDFHGGPAGLHSGRGGHIQHPACTSPSSAVNARIRGGSFGLCPQWAAALLLSDLPTLVHATVRYIHKADLPIAVVSPSDAALIRLPFAGSFAGSFATAFAFPFALTAAL